MADSSLEPSPSKRTKYDISQSFEVLVGPEKKSFTVVRDVLTARSGFFEASQSPRWKPDTSKPTDLIDHDPQEFQDYLEIVYTGGLGCSDDLLVRWYNRELLGDKWEEGCSAHVQFLQKLAKLYVLADKLEDSTSANIIINKFLECHGKSDQTLPPQLVMWVYEHTLPTSPLRIVVRDATMYETTASYFEDLEEDELPNGLMIDMLREYKLLKASHPEKTLSKACPYDFLEKRPKCHYHQHNDKIRSTAEHTTS